LGFSKNEADVYVAMMEIGQTGAGDIIRRTGLHRFVVYEILEQLISKKLVLKVFKKSVAQYVITNPQRIVENQKAALALADQLVPEILSKSSAKSDIIIWDGLEGFRNFSLSYIQQMKPKTTLYCIGSTGDRWYMRMGESADRFLKIQKQKKIHWKMISFEDPSVSSIDINTMEKDKLNEVRMLPKNQAAPANVIIWEDNVGLQIFTDPISVIEMKSKALADSYMLYFNTMWEQAVRNTDVKKN
jgi:sugar-specific transcriptional regulator TrmB